MKNLFIVLALCALSFSSAYSLEPLNVSIINTNAGPHNLTVEVNNYDGGVANVYTENFNGLTPNSSGVISFTLGVGSPVWTGIAASSVSSYYIIDVKIGTLYAQYRLDELIRLQAQSGITDKDGNIIPGESDASTLGSDDQRWKDVFVGPASIHIGESGDEGSINFTTGTNTLNLNADVTNTSGDLTVGGAANFEIKGNNGNLTTAGRVDIANNLRFTGAGAFITHTLGGEDIRVHNNFVIGNAGNDNFKVVNGNGNTTIKGKTEINNNSTGAGNASLKLTNDDATNESFALNITQGHQALSVDNNTATIGDNDAITVGTNTIIRLKSGGGDISGNLISDGQSKGQILYITNEDAGEIDLDDSNIIGSAKIDQRSVLHLIWLGNKWAVVNRY